MYVLPPAALRSLCILVICLACCSGRVLSAPTIGQNEAPILDVSRSPVLLETAAGIGPPVNGVLAGTPIALLVDAANVPDGLDNVLDTDASENDLAAWRQLGLALTSVGTGGSWYFTTNNCATWSLVPSVSIVSSLLLAADANTRIYFSPTTAVGDVTIQFRAWDGSSGANGTLVNTSLNGGNTAFSVSTDVATCHVFNIRQVATTGSIASSSVIVPSLPNAQVGDVKVLIVATSPGQPVSTSQFITLVDQVQPGPTNSRLYVGWRVVTSPEPAYSVSLGASSAFAACIMAIPDLDTGVPVPVQASASQATAVSLSHTAPAVLPALLPALVTSFHELANSTTWTPPPGMTEDADRSSHGTNALGVGLEANHLFRSASGSAGPYTALASNAFTADAGAAATVAWRLRNSAPMLDVGRSPVLNDVAANAPPPVGPVGTLVSALIDPANSAGGLDNLHDINGSAFGIAVIAVYAANGSWYFSTDNGAAWSPMGLPSFSVSRLLAADAGTRIYFQPSPGFSDPVPAAITFRAWDMTTGSNGGTANASVNGGSTAFSFSRDVASIGFTPNIGPVNSVPAPLTTDEDMPRMLSSVDGTALSTSDPDSGPADVRMSLALSSGTGVLVMNSTVGIQITGGADNSPAISFTGPVAAINAVLDGLLYVPTPDFSGTATLTVTTDDLGNSGAGGPLSDVDLVTITVEALNDPPVVLGPPAQSAPANTALTFAAANGNAWSIADVDAGTAEVVVDLVVTNGTATLGTSAGLDFIQGDGELDAEMTFIGTVAEVNSAVSQITFMPAPDFGGPASLSITVDDQGANGAGGALVSWGTVDIAVTTSYLTVSPRVYLDGPYNSGTGLMSDALRLAGLVPIQEPYTALGYGHSGGGGGESTTAAVLATTGPNAPVDWVVVELRDPGDPTLVLASRSALLQRDGDVVDTNGVSPVRFPLSAGWYHVAVRHRNHLGAMTEGAVALSIPAASVDFTSAATPVYGTDARRSNSGAFPAMTLWAGDVTRNKEAKYTGVGNDRDMILLSVGSATPNATASGLYSAADVNMDGLVRYTGTANDRDRILITVGSTTPNTVRPEQLPQ